MEEKREEIKTEHLGFKNYKLNILAYDTDIADRVKQKEKLQREFIEKLKTGIGIVVELGSGRKAEIIDIDMDKADNRIKVEYLDEGDRRWVALGDIERIVY